MPVDVNGVDTPCLQWLDRWAEMVAHFERCTYGHIDLVRKYCQRLADAFPAVGDELRGLGAMHDFSKFAEPERTPYIWITWQARCRDLGVPFDLPPGMAGKMREAVMWHVCANRHHPECWDAQAGSLDMINAQDKDALPARTGDATQMPEVYLLEMAADWCAVAEERGNAPVQWADANVNVRWAFTDAQRKVIYDALAVAWQAVTP